MYIILYKEAYEKDVIEAYEWYNAINHKLAEKFLLELKESEEILVSNPKANARIFNKNYRRYVMEVFPYKIIYAIVKNRILIFALIHTARSHKFIKRKIK